MSRSLGKEVEKKIKQFQKEMEAKKLMKQYNLTLEEAVAYIDYQRKKEKREEQKEKMKKTLFGLVEKSMNVSKKLMESIEPAKKKSRKSREKRNDGWWF